MTENIGMTAETPNGQYAGFVSRLIAFVIDQLIIAGTLAVTAAFVEFLLQSFRLSQVFGIEDVTAQIILIALGFLAAVLNLGYYVAMWVLAGQTPGKRIMGLLIVGKDGSRIRPNAAVRRWLGYWLSGILFLGYLWVLVDDRRQGWHDKLAGTLVVYAWPEQEPAMGAVWDQVRQLSRKRGLDQGIE